MNDLEISGGSLTALLHSGDALPPMMRDIFLVKQSIVGTRFLGGSEDLVEDLAPGSKVTLLREPDNRFDDRAVMALDGEGRKLGYIPRRENGVISALMDAGKLLYGIVSGEPHKRDESNPASSYSLWIDLYMREYVSPMDLTSIPRQGAQASYAVTAPVFGKKSGDLRGFHALRVINGEERGQIRIDFGGEHGRPMSESVQHFYDKLLRLRELMNTPAAAALAEERHAFLEAFLAQYYKETGEERP